MRGQFLNATMADYLVPMASEMPDIVTAHVEGVEEATLLGAKGVGEAGTIGANAAAWLAVNDALAPLGASAAVQPFTPERILQAIEAGALSRGRFSSGRLQDREAADPRDRNLGYFNRAAAAAHGDRVAVIDLSRNPAAEISHARLDARMERFAAALAGLGLALGERLLLAMENRHEFIEVFFGAMRAGVVPMPLNIKLAAETIASHHRGFWLPGRGGLTGLPSRDRSGRRPGGACGPHRDRAGPRRVARLRDDPRTGRSIVVHSAVDRRPPARLPALHVGLDRAAQGRAARP